jgi:hypothetical protein
VNIRLLIAGAAIGALAAGGASAHTARHFHRAMREASITYRAPAQPVPYAQLDHYLHASRAERKSIEMASANTGGAADTSASTSDTSQGAAPMTEPSPAAAPPENGMTPPASSGAVNPPTSATPSEPAPPAGATPPMGTTPATTPPPSSPQ